MTKKIAIIPARGGSKRIPRKNIKEFCGKPIIAYSIESALLSKSFDTVMVSTDDDEIAEVAKHFGAEVPFMREPELANDMAMTAPVLESVIKKYKTFGLEFEYLCCIYPTAPFITHKKLSQAMELLVSSGADSIVPVVKFSYPPQRCLVYRNNRIEMLYPENYNVRSQDLEPLYHDSGQFYCLQTQPFLNQKKLFCENSIPIILNESEVQDIDNDEDWKIAEMKYQIIKSRENF